MEGETERNYFNSMKERDSNIRIVLVKPGPADPVRLVEACVDHMKDRDVDTDGGDLAICAFDVDENPPERIARALQLAEVHGIIIALSNPCFELWLTLHYEEVHRSVDRREAAAMIKRRYPKYTKTCDLKPMLAHRAAAMRRSRAIMNLAGATDVTDLVGINPSSSMHLALEAIDKLKERNRGKRGSCR